MSPEDIQVGKIYEAKRPAKTGSIFRPVWNDRQVLWINADRTRVQYDAPSVKFGQKQPTVDMEKFVKWAGKELSKDLFPDGDWRPANEA